MPWERARYDRVAALYDLMEWPLERLVFARLRPLAVERASGRVLEVGVGTGKNLPLYPGGVELTGIDVSPAMLRRARERSHEEGGTRDLRVMDARDMAFADNRFDTVVSCLVLCSIAGQDRALNEMRRVLVPGGMAVFLEHQRSASPWVNRLLRLAGMVTGPLLGDSMQADTESNIRAAGFVVNERRTWLAETLRLLVCTVEK